MFSKITNPLTNEKYSINSKQGKQLLKQYVKLINGGAVDPTSVMNFP